MTYKRRFFINNYYDSCEDKGIFIVVNKDPDPCSFFHSSDISNPLIWINKQLNSTWNGNLELVKSLSLIGEYE